MTGAVIVDIAMGHVMGLSEKAQRQFMRDVDTARRTFKDDTHYRNMGISNAAWKAEQADETEAEEAANPAKVYEFKPRPKGCAVRPRRARAVPALSDGMTMPVA